MKKDTPKVKTGLENWKVDDRSQEQDRRVRMAAEREQRLKVSLKNQVYRTLVSLVTAMSKHLTPLEALLIVEGEIANIRKDVEKAERRKGKK